MKTTVIETHLEEGVEWGLSFSGCHPSEDEYFIMDDKETAFRLSDYINNQKSNDLKSASVPLIKYLCENHHPHVTAIVTPTSVEIMEGKESIPKILDFLVD